MTRHDADQVITGYADPNGNGAGWSEETVGRVRKDGGWDRRYTRRYRQSQPQAEPFVDNAWRTALEVVAGVVVLGTLFIGIGVWMWIAAAAEMLP